MRSDNVKSGTERAPHRSLFTALGYTDEELQRPLIGVVNSYNEITSAAIQGIALCINKIIKFIPQGKLYPTIRNILFAKQQSWYHSLDILRVIKNIDPKLFVQKLGENLFIELVRGLVGYCFCAGRI